MEDGIELADRVVDDMLNTLTETNRNESGRGMMPFPVIMLSFWISISFKLFSRRIRHKSEFVCFFSQESAMK